MAHSDNTELDIEPTVGRTKTLKFRDIKSQPRWKRIGQRRTDYDEHAQSCELIGDQPFLKHSHGHISAAKLKGSPEYNAKVAKMSERRNRVRHHEPAVLTTNVRWCGCCTDSAAPEKTICGWCAEYGAPDMKRTARNKWGQEYANSWTQAPKKRKTRPHDKPCSPPFTTPVSQWNFEEGATFMVQEPVVFPRRIEPQTFIQIIYNDYENAFYDFYP